MDALSEVSPIEFGQLSGIDLLAIGLYLAGLAAVTVYVNLRVGSSDAEHYFLGGRDVPFWAIGASLFASNLGTDHLVGLAGSGAASGLAVGLYEWNASYILLLLGWLFVPHYLACRIYTVPEYLEHRYGKSLRVFFTWLSIATAVFTKISVTIFAGAVVMKEVLGWNMWWSSCILLLLTSIYTTIGGLAAVVYTEVMQSAILLVGSSALLWYGMNVAGGWSGLKEKLPASHFTLLRPLSDPDFPWLGVLLGMPINSIWYWCTDQVMVQRVLASKNLRTSQEACVMAGWLKVTPMYLMVLPGLVAAALFPRQIAEDSNRAFALLVTRLLPPGWQGPLIAVMLSSFMAALASCFNSCSTLFTMDVYTGLVPDHSEAQLVRAGRLFTVFLALLSLAWLPVIAAADSQLFLYIQGMQVIWCSPVAVVFLASVLSDTVSATTAWVTLLAGIVAGLLFWLIREVVPSSWQGAFTRDYVLTLNILHFAIVIFLLDTALLLAVHTYERFTAHSGEQAPLLGARFSAKDTASQEWAGWPTRLLAVALMATVAALTVWHQLAA